MALALEGAQVFEITRARAQQLATLSEVALEFTGPQVSVGDVLARVARGAQRLFGTTGAAVWVPGAGEEIELAASIGPGQKPGRRLKRGEGLAGRVFSTGAPVRVGDYAAARGASDTFAGAPFHAALAVPMTWQGQIRGVLALTHGDPSRAFSADDENIAGLFAAQAAATLENARLFAEAQKRLTELAAINAVSQTLTAQSDLQALIDQVGDEVGKAFGHDAIIALYDGASGMIELPYFKADDGTRETIPPFPLGEGLTSHVIRTRRPLLINRDAARAVAELGAKQQGAPARSWLGVPVTAGDEVIGAISVQDMEREDAFTPDDVRLLTTIAANVGVAVQNARLFEQRQQRAAELAVVNELARAISEQLEPTQVLQTVYHQVQRITPLDGFFVTLYDPATGLQTTPVIYEEGRRSEEGPRPLPARGLIRHVIETGEPARIRRTPEEVEKIALSPEHAMGHASRVAASLLYLPLHFGQQVGGVMSVQSYEFNAYSERHVEVLTAVANHVVVALQNARLFEETQRRAEQLATAAEIARATISVLNPDELIVRAVELIRDRFERSAGVYYAALFLIDESGRWARLRHATGQAGRVLLERGHRLEVGGNSMVGWSTANRRARIALDVGAEPVRFANPLLPHTRSELALPLAVGDTVFGALDVQSTKSGAFSEADIAVLQTMADQVAVALQNARLFERTARQARRERLVVDITSKIRATTDVDSMLRTAVEELRSALGVSHAAVRFGLPEGGAGAAAAAAGPATPAAAGQDDAPAARASNGENGAHRGPNGSGRKSSGMNGSGANGAGGDADA
jgi:GAF domain-containing protein